MRTALKEFALTIGGGGLGIVLFMTASSYISTFGPLFPLLPDQSWGYPLPWLFQVGDLYMPPTHLIFGLTVEGTVRWSAFYDDLAFWLALPLATIELSTHFAIPYVWQALKLRRAKRRTTLAFAFGSVEMRQ